MNSVIVEKFNSWKAGLDPQEARIKIFEQVRDIPYALIPQAATPALWVEEMLKNNQGSCGPKHFLLGELFSMLGITVKYYSFQFSWDGPQIDYPAGLRDLARRIRPGYHLAMKAYLGDRWALIDATWDLKLEKAGFPVNKDWDGLSDTKNAVMAQAEFAHDSVQERLDFSKTKREAWTEKDRLLYAEFISQFNLWVASLRQAGEKSFA